jgi:hypothetical protein
MNRSPWGIPRAVRATLRADAAVGDDRSAARGYADLVNAALGADAAINPRPEPMTRTCRICKQELPLHEFRQVGARWRRTECRACAKLMYKQRKAAYPAAWRDAFLRRTYHISAAQYEEKLALQNGVCAICGQPERSLSARGGARLLHVDHDHRTGHVRALLCSGCNSGLGGFRDSIELLTKAIAYLQAHETIAN